MRIETLSTCHNRRQKTLQALADLHAQELPKGVEMGHTMVEDGSTDGTREAIEEAFPDVEVVPGDGDLFWAGGMRLGWERSVKHKEFDYLFVYNDDIKLKHNAVDHLLGTANLFLELGGETAHAVSGAFTDSNGGGATYSGAIKSSIWHPFRVKRVEPPNEGFIFVDTMNMNGVLISRSALKKVGFLSDFFKHSGADFEFGLKLNRSGGKVLLAASYIGFCDRNSGKGTSSESGISLYESYRRLLGPKEQPPMERFKYCKKYSTFLLPILWASPYVKQPFRFFWKLGVRLTQRRYSSPHLRR